MANTTSSAKDKIAVDFDFKKIKQLKENEKYFAKVEDVICAKEEMIGAYSAGRDGVIFTNKRIIMVNVKGATSKKKAITSIPYKQISVFRVVTAGTFNHDAELIVFIAGMGKIDFEFRGKCNMKEISACIAEHIE